MVIALLMPVFAGMVGLVVDVGQMYETRRELQNGSDAAALAGAAYLPEHPSDAVAAAVDYAHRNGVTITSHDVLISETYVANDTIRVNAGRNLNYSFARVFGMTSGNVTAKAKVVVGTMGGGTGLMPWALFPPNYQYGDPVTLKYAPGFNEGGNFGPLAIDGTGASVYWDTIVHGSRRLIRVGDLVDTETGNMNGPTKQGLRDLIGNDSTTFSQAVSMDTSGNMSILLPGCPRLVLVPIITQLPSGGRQEVRIVGFAQVFITDFGGGGNDSWVKAIFVRVLNPEAVWTPIGGSDYGMRIPKLVE